MKGVIQKLSAYIYIYIIYICMYVCICINTFMYIYICKYIEKGLIDKEYKQ